MATERAKETQEQSRQDQARQEPARQEASRQQQSQESRKSGGEERGVSRRENALRAAPTPIASPFDLMLRFMEDLDRIFEPFDLGPGLMPRIDLGSRGEGREAMWVPSIEILERDGQLVIRADVPGMSKDQINVQIEDGQLVISGERRQEQEERRGGFYRSEKSYGAFYRAVPLPEGVDPEQARATFRDGVLEVTMPAPERASGRRLEIQDGSQSDQGRQQARQEAARAEQTRKQEAKSA